MYFPYSAIIKTFSASIGLFLFAHVLIAADSVVEDALQQPAVVSYLDDLQSFQAQFAQTRYDENGVELEVSAGDCWVERPGRFRWDYHAPYAQSIVSDGTQLWIYDVDLEQVTVNQIDNSLVDSPAALLGQQMNVEEHFDLQALPQNEDGVNWYALKPKRDNRDFQLIELGLKAEEVRFMRLRDSLGQTTALSFSNIKRNNDIDDERFTFQIPVGVDLIEGGMP